MPILQEIPEVKEMGTEGTAEYNELLNRELFEELTINTSQILQALSEEPNDVPKEEIASNRDDHDGLFAEEVPNKNLISIRILTPENHSKISIEVSTGKRNLFAQPITSKTYTELQKFVIDPEVAMMNAKSKLKNAI